MDSRDRRAFPTFVLFVAIFFGLMVRLTPAILIGAPVGDGGMFYQTVLDLQAGAYRLPLSISYNNLQSPFAYPPLGFYLAGLIQLLTRASLLRVFTYWPAITSTLSIPAFYFVATAVLKSRLRAAIAAVFYATSPVSFYLPFMGGGITRAPALAFSLLALGCFYRLFDTHDKRYVCPAAGFLSLTALSHPETIFHTTLSILLFGLMARSRWKNLGLVFIVAAITGAVTSPWWVVMLQRYGISPFITAFTSNLRDGLAPIYLLQFNLTGEVFLTVAGVLAAVGLALTLRRKEWLLPAWIVVAFLTSWRASPFSAIFPVAMLASLGIERLVGETTEPFSRLFASGAQRTSLLILFAYCLASGMWAGTGVAYEQRITTDERAFLSQIASLTPANGRFLVLTGGSPAGDAFGEWFPTITGRVSVANIQGHEWMAAPNISEAYWESADLQACLDQTAECVDAWSNRYRRPFDYVYVRRVRTLKTGETQLVSSLLEYSLRQSPSYTVISDSSVGVVFQHK